VRAAPAALPFGDASIAALSLSLLGDGSEGGARVALLAELARVCVPGGVLVAVDHNRPRRRAAAFVAVVAPPRPPGRTPAARWRRLAYPAAREVWAAGFTIERLRLAAGERVQVVFARRAAPQNFAHQGTKRLPGTSTTTEY
jgi:SAM-dependent methyltransferase